GELSTSRVEADRVEFKSGVFRGRTTGAPICMTVRNLDVDSTAYEEFRFKPRPGHADYPAYIRYGGFNDYRGGGLFSGRMTVAYVMAGAVAKKLLSKIGVEVYAHTVQIGCVKLKREVNLEELKTKVYNSRVRCVDQKLSEEMERVILEAAAKSDSVGGVVEGLAFNVPAGLGDPLFGSIDGDIARLLFNIPAVKAVEFGAGVKAASMMGSEFNDQYVYRNGRVETLTNNSGGVLGGLSNGMPIVVRVSFKPTPSVAMRQKTIDLLKKENTFIEIKGRYDPCVVPRAVPVVEACLALVIADHCLTLGSIPKVFENAQEQNV
ncbi:chorismate synthase, partial [Candidatus Bathyarchaeota archaeon]|nr:chorismate synthase [Candidatus Bathyarchaeota archaeon]